MDVTTPINYAEKSTEELVALLVSKVDPALKEDPEISQREAREHVTRALKSLCELCLLEA